MVQLIEVVRNGKTVWLEVSPAACAAGHRQLVPMYSTCPEPTCGEPCRQWQCRAEGCTAPTLVDDEHVHGSRR
jgi:hypothetical protein